MKITLTWSLKFRFKYRVLQTSKTLTIFLNVITRFFYGSKNIHFRVQCACVCVILSKHTHNFAFHWWFTLIHIFKSIQSEPVWFALEFSRKFSKKQEVSIKLHLTQWMSQTIDIRHYFTIVRNSKFIPRSIDGAIKLDIDLKWTNSNLILFCLFLFRSNDTVSLLFILNAIVDF